MLKIEKTKKTIVGNMVSCFPPPLKKTFGVFGIHLVMFENQQFLGDKFL